MICTTRAANVQVGPFVHNAGAGAVMQAGPHEALSRDVGEHDFGSLIKEGSGLILSVFMFTCRMAACAGQDNQLG